MTNKPKIALLDIETSHNVIAAFRVQDKYYQSTYHDILVERHILTAAWQWLGSRKIHGVSLLDDAEAFEHDPHDDSVICKTLVEMFAEADAVVAHYGDKFDMAYIRTRCLANGLRPFKPPVQIDTWKIARSQFLLNSNSLDYLAKLLGLKRKHKPRSGLWLECLEGGQRRGAFREMLAYNKDDVRLLGEVFDKLRPWVPAKLNHRLFDERDVCETCGSTNIEYRGYHYSRQRKTPRYNCLACGHWGVSKCRQSEKLK